MRCYDLLRFIRANMDAAFVDYAGGPKIEKESQLLFLTAYIFQIEEGAAEVDEKGMRSKALVDAGKLMSTFSERRPGGESEEMEKVKRFSCRFGGLELRIFLLRLISESLQYVRVCSIAQYTLSQ